MIDDWRRELQALLNRAVVEEARRDAALARGDAPAVRDAEIELSRLHSRYLDLRRQHEPA